MLAYRTVMEEEMKAATRGQILELVVRHGALMGRIADGSVGYDEAQAIIERPKPSVSMESVRTTQARRLYDIGFGGVLGCSTFEVYLDAEGKDSLEPVPQIPLWPASHTRLFGQNIWLVDGRVVEKVGLKEYCRLAGLVYSGEDDTFVAHDPNRAKSGIRWMLGQDGFRNRDRKPVDCRSTHLPFEVGMDVIEGVSVYIHDSTVIEGHYLDLPGSVPREDPGCVGCLGVFDGGPGLYWSWGGNDSPDVGSASRAE